MIMQIETANVAEGSSPSTVDSDIKRTRDRKVPVRAWPHYLPGIPAVETRLIMCSKVLNSAPVHFYYLNCLIAPSFQFTTRFGLKITFFSPLGDTQFKGCKFHHTFFSL